LRSKLIKFLEQKEALLSKDSNALLMALHTQSDTFEGRHRKMQRYLPQRCIFLFALHFA
jgi:hypothetical protein